MKVKDQKGHIIAKEHRMFIKFYKEIAQTHSW